MPGQTLAHQLAHLTPREISQAVQDAVGRAINLGRLHLSVEDFPPELLGVENVRVAFH